MSWPGHAPPRGRPTGQRRRGKPTALRCHPRRLAAQDFDLMLGQPATWRTSKFEESQAVGDKVGGSLMAAPSGERWYMVPIHLCGTSAGETTPFDQARGIPKEPHEFDSVLRGPRPRVTRGALELEASGSFALMPMRRHREGTESYYVMTLRRPFFFATSTTSSTAGATASTPSSRCVSRSHLFLK